MHGEISTILLIVRSSIKPKKEETITITLSPECILKLFIRYNEPGSDYYGYNIGTEFYNSKGDRLLISQDHSWAIALNDIVVMHANLDTFVEKICEIFPEVRTKIKELLKAGRVE
jgi:hypothetical protein